MPHNEALRSRVAAEILDSERTYEGLLAALADVVGKPLLGRGGGTAAAAAATPVPLQRLLATVDPLLSLCRMLISDLEPLIKGWSSDSELGDVFVKVGPFFKLYTEFVEAHSNCVAVLCSALQQSAPLRSFLDECAKDPRCRGQNLQSLLILPIQRVPRYMLLLRDLRKATAEEHADHAALGAALEVVGASASRINEGLRVAENRSAMLTLSTELSLLGKHGIDIFDSPGRTLVREGDLLKLSRRAELP